MDFQKPLNRLEGFIIYTTLLDYIDTFVHDYASKKDDNEYPPISHTFHMIRTLLEDFRKIEPSDFPATGDIDIASILETLGNKLASVREEAEATEANAPYRKNQSDPVDHSENAKGSFKMGKKAPKTDNQVETPLEPFLLKTKQDIDWLTSVGITPLNKELITPKKKRKPKNES